VDDLIPLSPNLVAGANETDYHYRTVNFGRDYDTALVADLTTAHAGDPCPECGNPLLSNRGVEVGNIFQLGTHYSDAMGCTYQDENDQPQPVIMGSYGIGIGRLLGCIAEQHNDEYGLNLPVTIAPYQVHLVVLQSKKSEQPGQVADQLYHDLQRARIEVLYDDRKESAGVKFNDADLIGIPLRITVAEKGLNEEKLELKYRGEKEKAWVAVEDIVPTVMERLLILDRSIAQTVVKEPYQ
jgi:prolyl-tRNA synthetase